MLAGFTVPVSGRIVVGSTEALVFTWLPEMLSGLGSEPIWRV